jgi:hypothetical protein
MLRCGVASVTRRCRGAAAGEGRIDAERVIELDAAAEDVAADEAGVVGFEIRG